MSIQDCLNSIKMSPKDKAALQERINSELTDGMSPQETSQIENKIVSEYMQDASSDLNSVAERAGAIGGQVNRIDLSHKDVVKRVPELTKAAQDLYNGDITKEEYRALVNRYKPVLPYKEIPAVATEQEMETSLGKKSDKLNMPVEEGTMVGLRLDIPSYKNHGTWVATIHDSKNKVMSYGSTAVIRAPKGGKIEFRNRVKVKGEEFPARYARGAMDKTPVATIDGEFVQETVESAVIRAEQAINDPNWVQVGYDPERSSLFYNRKTMAPIYGAEEVIQIGSLVLAKNAEHGEQSDPQVLFERALLKEDGYEALNMMSTLERAILRMELPAWNPTKKNPEGRAYGENILANLKKQPKVKAEEIAWTGMFQELLTRDTKTKYSREEVHQLYMDNKINVEMQIAGGFATRLNPDDYSVESTGRRTINGASNLAGLTATWLDQKYGSTRYINKMAERGELPDGVLYIEPLDLTIEPQAIEARTKRLRTRNVFSREVDRIVMRMDRMLDPSHASELFYENDLILPDGFWWGESSTSDYMDDADIAGQYLLLIQQQRDAVADQMSRTDGQEAQYDIQADFVKNLRDAYSMIRNMHPNAERYTEHTNIDFLADYTEAGLPFTDNYLDAEITNKAQEVGDITAEVLEFTHKDSPDETSGWSIMGRDDVGWWTSTHPIKSEGTFPTKEALTKRILEHKSQVDGARTRHEMHVGGWADHDNYSELLIRLPDSFAGYAKEDHFYEENVVAFIRATERTFESGDKSWHMDELQSDWHQDGSKTGYLTRTRATPEQSKTTISPSDQPKVKRATNNLMSLVDQMADVALDNVLGKPVSSYTEKMLMKHLGVPEAGLKRYTKAIEEGSEFGRETLENLHASMYVSMENNVQQVAYDTYRFLEAMEQEIKSQYVGGYAEAYNTIASLAPVEMIYLSLYQSNANELDITEANVNSIKKLRALALERQDAFELAHSAVPDAPFKKEGWMRIGLKQAIIQAVKNGNNYVTWGNSRQHVNDWSAEFNSGYTNVYDKALPRVARELGLKVFTLNEQGNPFDFYDETTFAEKPPFDKYYYINEVESTGMWRLSYMKNLQSGRLQTYSTVGTSSHQFESREEALKMAEILYETSAPIKQAGVFAVPITPELKQRVLDDELSLFQLEIDSGEKVNIKAGNRATLDTATSIANKKQYRTNRELKMAIQEAVQEASEGGGNPSDMTEQAMRHIIKVGIKDGVKSLESNSNAVGWYDERVSKALSTMALIHPELNTEPKAKVAFIWALAVTSNGAKVDKNFEVTEKAYAYWKKNGKMPTNVGIGKPAAQINKGMKAYNELIDSWGHELVEQFMDSSFTVAQLKAMGFKISDELATETVRGSAILGAKIGNGFYSNLRGKFDALTMDRWLMATWGRWTGNLVGEYSKRIAEKEGEMTKLITTFSKRSPAKLEEFSKLIGVDLIAGKSEEIAHAIWKSSQKPKNRKVMNKTKSGEALRKIGNSITDLRDGQILTPQNSTQRAFIRKTFSGILVDLQKDNPDLTMADLQALLWYAEKTLYANAKSKESVENFEDDEAPDYANASRDVALSQGVPLQDIQQTWSEIDEQRKLDSARQLSEESKVESNSEQATGRGFNKRERGAFLLRTLFTPDRIGRGRNEKPQPFKRASTKRNREVRGIEATWSAVADYKKVAGLSEIGVQDYHELTPSSDNSKKFHKAILKSKNATEYGASVYVYTKPEYQKMRMFLNEAGDAGFAIKEDGDIVSVFTGGGAHAYSIINLAVQAGGKKLDAFDTVLPKIYGTMGFVEVGRDSWNEKRKPDDWDKNTFSLYNNGEPDVVYMEYRNADQYADQQKVYNQPNNEKVNEARGNILFQGDKAIITLFNSSDRSTFMHESGHLFLEMERRLADPDNLTEDQQKILNWLGVDSFDEIDVEHHEKWARGFERYIMEGNAPSNALKDAFAFMSKWLTDLYRKVKNLNVELDDSVRGVMDRMLATDDQIAMASAGAEFDQYFKDAESAGMTPKEFEAYQKRIAKSKRTAEETLREKLMKEITRKTKSWWNKEKTSLIDHHTVQLTENDKFYEVLNTFKGNENENADNKINRASMNEYFNGSVPIEYQYLLSDASNITVDDVTETFGYDSPETFVGELKEKPALKKKAEQLAEKDMLDKHGDILNDGTIEMEVDIAMRNENQAELLLFELKMLYRKAKRKPDVDRVAIRQQAVELIRNTPVSKLTPAKYRRAEVKYAKQSQKATDEGRIDDAIQAKKLQIINQHLYREATQAKEKADRLARRMQKVKNRKYDPKSINMQYANHAKLLLSAYDFRVNNKEDMETAMARAQAVATWVAGQQADLDPVIALDPNLRKIIDGESITLKPRQEMTLMELQNVADQIDHMLHVGRLVAEENQQKKLAGYEKLAQSILENAHQGKDNQLSMLMEEYANQIFLTADSVARKLDGNTDGLIIQNVKRPIDEAVTENLIPMQEKSGDDIKSLYDRHYTPKQMRQMNKRIHIPHLGRSMTKWEIVSLALNWGNESSREAILASEVKGERQFQTQEDVTRIFDEHMEKNDWDFAQSTWDYVNSYWDRLSAIEQKRTGVTPQKVQPVPFETPHGIYRGGYYPLKYDSSGSIRVKEEDVNNLVKGNQAGRFAKASTPDGMLIERQGSGGRPVLLDMSVFHRHIAQTIHVIALSEPVAEVQALLSSKPIKDAVEATGNTEALQALDIWLKDVATGEIASQAWLEKLFRNIRGGFSSIALGWNVGTMLMQPLGLFQSMPFVGFNNTMTQMMKYFGDVASMATGNKHQMTKTALEKSAFLRERGLSFNKDLADVMNNIGDRGSKQGGFMSHLPNAPMSVKRSLFGGIVFTQRFVDVITWHAGFEKYMKENPDGTEKDAIYFADRSVARTQSSGNQSDRTPVERGTISPNVRGTELVRIWTTLGSYFFAKGNLIAERTRDTDFASPAQLALWVRDMMFLTVLEGMVVAWLKNTAPDEDDDESYTAFVATEGLKTAVGSYPFFRILGSEASGFRGGSVVSSGSETAYKGLDSIADVIESMWNEDVEVNRTDIRRINDLLGMGFKYPSKAMYRAGEALYDDLDGEDVGVLDYLIYREEDE